MSDTRPTVLVVPRPNGPYAPYPPNLAAAFELAELRLDSLPLSYDFGQLDHCDGVVLQGGSDVRSLLAVASDLRAGYDRDLAEHAVVQGAIQLDLPILGICRGMQLLNEYLGGSTKVLPDFTFHGESSRWALHDVAVQPQSRLAQFAGSTLLRDCSSHHRRILDRVASPLRVIAWATDGSPEAVEGRSARVLGVQWHPEDTARDDAVQVRLLRDFFRA